MNKNTQYINPLEAINWLKNNKNRSALATNRFGDTKNALEFVERLYNLGAIVIIVGNILDDEWRIKEEGGPYADSLIIELPQEPKKRKVLFQIINEESEREGFPATEDTGQNKESFWWD